MKNWFSYTLTTLVELLVSIQFCKSAYRCKTKVSLHFSKVQRAKQLLLPRLTGSRNTDADSKYSRVLQDCITRVSLYNPL